jgi:hypothetical protein
MDVKHILAIVEALRFFVIAQHTHCETSYKKEYEIAVKARNSYYGVTGGSSSSKIGTKSSGVTTKNSGITTISGDVNKRSGGLNGVSGVGGGLKRGREERGREGEGERVPARAVTGDVPGDAMGVLKEAWRFLSRMDHDRTFAVKVSDLVGVRVRVSERVRATLKQNFLTLTITLLL